MIPSVYEFILKRIRQTNFQEEWIEENLNYYKNDFYDNLYTYLSLTSRGKRLGKNHEVVENFLQTIQNSIFLPADIFSSILSTFTIALINIENKNNFYNNDSDNNKNEFEFLENSIKYFLLNYPEIFINIFSCLSEIQNINYVNNDKNIKIKDVFHTLHEYNENKHITYSDNSDLSIDYFLNKFSYKYIYDPEINISQTEKIKYFTILNKYKKQLFIYNRINSIKNIYFIRKNNILQLTNFSLFLHNLRVFLLKHIDINNVDICPNCSTVFYINYSNRKYCSRKCTTYAASLAYTKRLKENS